MHARPLSNAKARLAVGLVAGAVLLASGCAAMRPMVRNSLTPIGAYAEEVPPPAPDYTQDAAWSALPTRADTADFDLNGTAVDQTRAPVDVFYVHPTSYVGKRWNAPVDDPKLNADTDRVATGVQAPVFNGCCAVYAPRYRQATGSAFIELSPDGAKAIELAYTDVRAAFEAFNARRGADRPFVLASHSQGSVMAERLLYEVIAQGPLRDRLVVAVLLGGGVTNEGLREHGLAGCATKSDTGCVVAWNARGPRFAGNEFELQRPDTRERLCTNPLSWTPDGAAMPASANLGAVFPEVGDVAPRVAFADAQCVGGTLLVRAIARAPRDLASSILDAMLGPENYHPIEVQMYFMNLRESVNARVAGFGG